MRIPLWIDYSIFLSFMESSVHLHTHLAMICLYHYWVVLLICMCRTSSFIKNYFFSWLEYIISLYLHHVKYYFSKKTIKFFLNVCSIKIDPVNYSICSISTITTEKWRNTVTLWCGGWKKLKRQGCFAAFPIAGSSIHQP